MLFRIMSIEDYFSFSIFIFALKIHFYVKMKIREIISNDIDLNECYPGHDPE